MKNKVTIIGAGMVGSTLAYSLITGDTTEEIALIDLDEKLARAQALDLQHAVPFCGSTTVKVGTYADCRDSKVVAICCGAAQKPGQTRLELVQKNAAIMKEIVPQVFAANPDTILIMVTNPVDVLTYLAVTLFPDKKAHIMGTGTLLDSARLCHLLQEKLHISAKNMHAYIVGEHGDSELALWSTATVGNMNIDRDGGLSKEEKEAIFQEAKNAAYTIIEGKQATYYAIGAGGAQLISAILHDERSVMPVSYLMEGEYGLRDVCVSMPAVIGRGGIIGKINIDLADEERIKLQLSEAVVKGVFHEIAS